MNPGPVFNDEIQIAPAAAPGLIPGNGTPFRSLPTDIPNAAPYWVRVREYVRLSLSFKIGIKPFGGETPIASVPSMPVAVEVLRGNTPIWKTEVDANLTFHEAEENVFTGFIGTDFVNPLYVYNGQSLAFRFSGVLPTVAVGKKVGISISHGFDAEGNISAYPDFIAYTERDK